MQRTKLARRTDAVQRRGVFFVGTLQPRKRTIILAKCYVDRGDLVTRYVAFGCRQFHFRQYLARVSAAAPFLAGTSNAQGAVNDGGRPVIAGYFNTGSPGGLDVAIARLQSDLIFKDRFEPPL